MPLQVQGLPTGREEGIRLEEPKQGLPRRQQGDHSTSGCREGGSKSLEIPMLDMSSNWVRPRLTGWQVG